MPITSGQLKLFLTGGAANADPDASLGGATSSVEFVNNTLENLFSHVPPPEAIAGSVKYRALAFKNTSGLTAYGVVVYVSTETSLADTTVAIAYDSAGTQDVADEDTAPSSPALSFSTPLSLAAGISLGDVAAGAEARIWFRRTVDAGAAVAAADTGAVRFYAGTI